MLYKAKAGRADQPPERWLTNELITLSTNKPLLVMFAHPKCPCTRASLAELESLVTQAKDRFEAAVLFYQPLNGSEEWSKTRIIESAHSISGVRVLLDQEGKVARRFGARTSGHTMVYSTNGKLLFSGGITGSRGHLGENGGCDAVFRIVTDDSRHPARNSAQVFGCELFDPCASNQTAQSN